MGVELDVVGGSYADPDYEKAVMSRLRALQLQDTVRFQDAVPHREILGWMSRSDVYVQPSNYESQCVALLEAMASGLPVVASELDAVSEYLTDGINGLLSAPGDPGSVADQVERLLLSPRLRREISARAREEARRFEWVKSQEDVLSLLCARPDTSATGECHDAGLADRLRSHAKARADELVSRYDVDGVLLAGSVASGPVCLGSDVDLHVFTGTREKAASIPPWRFLSEEIIENVQVDAVGLLEEGAGLIGDDDALAEWFYRTSLGDSLARARDLTGEEGFAHAADIRELVLQRARVEIRERLVHRYASDVERKTQVARELAAAGAPTDGHQILRAAVQDLLVASLVRIGWTLRGSKKRPEIAASHLPAEGVEAALDVLLDVSGVRGISKSEALKLSGARFRLRGLLVEEARRLTGPEGADGLRASIERHERNAVDYYCSLIHGHVVHGPVNHIRCLSGFASIPDKVMSIVGRRSTTPVTAFLESEAVSGALRSEWAAIALLEADRSTVERWSSTTEATARRIQHLPIV